MSAYKRAQLVYERIQKDKRQAAEKRRKDNEKREEVSPLFFNLASILF